MSDWSAVTVVTAPTAQPVSVGEVKDHLRVVGSDDDALIQSLLGSAIAAIDGPNGIGVGMMTQTWRYTLDAFPSGDILLPGGRVASVTSVKYYDGTDVEQTWATSNYRVDVAREPARVSPVNSWPTTKDRIGAVWVDYVVGGASADKALVGAIKMLVGHWYENREAVMIDAKPHLVPLAVDHILCAHRRGIA